MLHYGDIGLFSNFGTIFFLDQEPVRVYKSLLRQGVVESLEALLYTRAHSVWWLVGFSQWIYLPLRSIEMWKLIYCSSSIPVSYTRFLQVALHALPLHDQERESVSKRSKFYQRLQFMLLKIVQISSTAEDEKVMSAFKVLKWHRTPVVRGRRSVPFLFARTARRMQRTDANPTIFTAKLNVT